jgi:hypothetical protein
VVLPIQTAPERDVGLSVKVIKDIARVAHGAGIRIRDRQLERQRLQGDANIDNLLRFRSGERGDDGARFGGSLTNPSASRRRRLADGILLTPSSREFILAKPLSVLGQPLRMASARRQWVSVLERIRRVVKEL